MKNVETNALFIFDANFFIALKEIHAKRPYFRLATARSQLEINFYISSQVFNELPFIVGTTHRNFIKAVNVEAVKENDLNQVKKDLTNQGVKLLAQDPDLSLIALGKSLKTDLNTIYVVTDDFKLNQNIQQLEYRIKCLPLPSFLQLLNSNLLGKEKSYWKWVRSKVLQYNLDYMMSRANIYNPSAKLTWLIENAVQLADSGIKLTHTKIDEDQELQTTINEEQEFLQLCEVFIQGKHLSKAEQKQIAGYENALEEIRKVRPIISKAKECLMNGEYRKTLAYLKKVSSKLNHHFQLMGAKFQLDREKLHFFSRIMTAEISKVLFLRAFVLIENDKINVAMTALDQTALFATMAQFPETVLSINYLKGILHIYNTKYSKAVEQFNFNYNLASILQLSQNLTETLQFKAIVGGAITNYLIGENDIAFSQIQQISSNMARSSIANLMTALVDSGDYFLALSFPEIASNLYSKAIECAVDAKKEWRYSFLLSKLKMAYMASSLISAEARPSGDISMLIDKFHDTKDIPKFNELMTQFADFTNKLYEPFVHFSQGRKLINHYDLPDELRNEWDCIKIQVDPTKTYTYLIGFKEEVGLVAFEIKSKLKLDGAPENYYLKLNESCKIRIKAPDKEQGSMFLIRAVIVINNVERDLDIIRKTPIFFKQMHI